MSFLEWANKNIVVKPSDIFTYFSKAQYVITDTFHGAVFSILLEKEFWILPTKSQKIKELLSFVNLNDRYLFWNEMENFEIKKIDFNVVRKAVDEQRESSIQFLIKNLEIENNF